MKNKFRAYFNLTEAEYKALWEKAFFSFDTNVLLDLYRYKKSTADTFLSLVQKIRSKNPVWLPYQVAKEFFRNRVEVIRSQRQTYAKTAEYLEKLVTSFKSEFPRHPYLPNDQYAERLQKTISEIVADIANLAKKHIDTSDTNNDDTLTQLLAIFEDNIGDRPTDDAHNKIIEKCKKRAERGLPPFTSKSKDAQKEGDDKYGDAVLWLELLEYAKSNKRPLIFVTSEKKDDWWYKLQGEFIGPRREMVGEMHESANQFYHLYSLDQFIAYGRSYFGEKPTPEAIEDVKAVADQKQEEDLHAHSTLKTILAFVERLRYLFKTYRDNPTGSRLYDFTQLLSILIAKIEQQFIITAEHKEILEALSSIQIVCLGFPHEPTSADLDGMKKSLHAIDESLKKMEIIAKDSF